MQLQRHACSFKEIVPACLLAGIGMIFAGTYVDWIKHLYLDNFDPCLLAIIPPLIGLKGNLEVTLSSRLSTMANIKAEISLQLLHLFLTTLVFILIQAVAAGSVISVFGVLLFPRVSSLAQSLSTIFNLMMVSILTSILSICTLSCLVFGLVICCLLFSINADNVAPPMAGAFGDLATVALLIAVNEKYRTSPSSTILLTLVLLVLLFLFGPWYLSRRLTSTVQRSSAADLHGLSITMETFINSVIPLFFAIILSSLSGQVLAHYAHSLANLARLQIAINGVGGCFGSIVVSRMLTRLHAHHKSKTNSSPPADRKSALHITSNTDEETSPFASRADELAASLSPVAVDQPLSGQHQLAARVMKEDAEQVTGMILLACVPLHSLLALISFLLQFYGVMQPADDRRAGRPTFQLATLFAYVCASFAQVLVVLHFARWIVFTTWHRILTTSESSTQEESLDREHVGGGEEQPGTGLCTRYQASLSSLDLTAVALTTGLGDLLGSVFLASALHYFQTT